MVQFVALLVGLVVICISQMIGMVLREKEEVDRVTKCNLDRQYIRDIYYLSEKDQHHIRNYTTKPKVEPTKTLKILEG